MKMLVTMIFLFSQLAGAATAATYRMSLDQVKPILTPGKFITISDGAVSAEDKGYPKNIYISGLSSRSIIEKFCEPTTLKHSVYLNDNKRVATDKETFHCFIKKDLSP